MIVLHGAALENFLLVWREPEEGKAALVAAVTELGAGFKFPKCAVREATAWLPTRNGQPAPSSALVSEAPLSSDECHLAPAIVTALPFGGSQAIDLLAACLGKRLVVPGVLVGEDLAYWAAALKLAAGLVTRGQFLPEVRPENAGHAARWHPVFAGAEASRLHSLARAMPPAARALTWETGDKEPDAPADKLARR